MVIISGVPIVRIFTVIISKLSLLIWDTANFEYRTTNVYVPQTQLKLIKSAQEIEVFFREKISNFNKNALAAKKINLTFRAKIIIFDTKNVGPIKFMYLI